MLDQDDDDFADSGWVNDEDLLVAANNFDVTHDNCPAPSSKRRKFHHPRYLTSPDDSLEEDTFDPPVHPTGRRLHDQRGSQDDDVAMALRRPGQPQLGQRLVGPQVGLRQTTLIGGSVDGRVPSSQTNKRHAHTVTVAEAPTHHKLDATATKTWIYPTNLGSIRDYQYNIVQKGLFHNLLVALPTGLGKTFIAATIMLNWFRWTVESQIVFVAPTKPLVAQQIDACFQIAGIPRSQTSMLTGTTSPALRAEEWSSKRVFFMTPQTFINDLKLGTCDPKKIVCLVVDEAHRATGSYSYVEVVKFIRRFNSSLRVLALTATPGASVEAVQEVIDGLDIARVEIRTEESLDIRRYVHNRNVDTVVFDPSPEIDLMRDLFSKSLQPILDKLNQANAYWVRDPMSLSAYGLTKAKQQWMASPAGKNASVAQKGMMHTLFTLLASLAHSITLLTFHGIGPFYHTLVSFRRELEAGAKSSKYRKQINESPYFQNLMRKGQQWINQPDFVGHPKLEYLRRVTLNHFMDAGEGRGAADGEPPSTTRMMIFVHYRDSAEGVVRVLKRNEPMIRPHVFVGQAGAKGSEGMNQKTQLEVIQKFKKGVYNTLVATCVGEEGLDIGEVDLIVCYDSSASPIRMLQRMGRTGRKRAGNIVLLLMRGKEEDSFTKAKDAYEKMQQMIAAGTRFTFHEDRSPRILPKHAQPVVDKRLIDVPLENTQADLPEPNRRRKAAKLPKKFHMPDGVRTGFLKASRLQGKGKDGGGENDDEEDRLPNAELREEETEAVPSLETVLLSKQEEQILQQTFQNAGGGDEVATLPIPRLDVFPICQRRLGRTSLVKHSQATERMVRTLAAMRDVDDEYLGRLDTTLHSNDGESGMAQLMAPDLQSDSGLEERESVPTSSAATSETDVGNIRRSNPSPTMIERTSSVDEDDDLGGIVVDDGDELPTPLTSSPSVGLPSKRFYTSPQKRKWRGSVSADELPEVSVLVEGGVGSSLGVPRGEDGSDKRGVGSSLGVPRGEDGSDKRGFRQSQRRSRRTVADSSDEEG